MVEKKINLSGCPNPYEKGLLGVSFSIDVINSLGKIQQEILHNLVVDYMTVKQIANRRNKSLSSVKNIIYKLRTKNIIDKLNRPIKGIKSYSDNGGGSSHLSPKNKKGLHRLHSEHHTIKLLGTSLRYLKQLQKSSTLPIDENKVMLYRRKIVVYSNTSFYNDVPDECFEKSAMYWHNFFLSLEANLGIKIYDGLNTEIRRFKCHIAKTNDPLAKLVIKHKLKYKFIDDLGRGRLEIDNSKGLWEFEAICNETCQDDINIIKDYQGDTITKEHYRPSDVKIKLDTMERIMELQVNHVKIKQGQDDEVLLMIKALTVEITKLKYK